MIRKDAFSKVTGNAKYVDDLRVSGTLYVQAVRCPHPHAKILKIDAEKARAMPGVVCVLTASDVKGELAGHNDKPVLVDKIAKHIGDGVALVVAETRAEAEAGAEKVDVEYEVLKSVHTVFEALASGAPKVHEDGNIACSHLIEKGDIDAGFAMSDIIFEREYSTQRVMHGAIEPDGALVVPENGGLTVYCPGKAPFATRDAVAKACGLQENEVRLKQPVIGGAFGGKYVDTNLIASRLAVAALITGRPCKTTWTREEVGIEGSKRHPFSFKHKVGVNKDGKINAIDIEGFADAGAYASVSKAVIWRAAVEAAGPYDIDNVRIKMYAVFTNNVYSDGVRGFGSPQVDFASESLMNELAENLGMGAIELRRKNIMKDGDKTATSQRLDEVNLDKCIDKLEEVFLSGPPPIPSSSDKVVGRGISCIFRGEARGAASGNVDGATVHINLNKDGSVNVLCGIAEMGQGGHNVVMQIVSETLEIPPEKVHVKTLDTYCVPDGGPTTGSRGTITFGNAAYAACQDLIKKKASGDFEGSAYWSLPETNWDFENNRGDTYSSYNYAAYGADIEADPSTGEVKLLKLVAIHDVGRMINEEETKGQIAGGASMALGYSLMEDIPIEDGKPTARNFDRYHIPTSIDMCEVTAIPITPRPGSNPLGVKGIGEPSSAAAAPAIINAINNALNIKIRNLPATPARILKELEAQR